MGGPVPLISIKLHQIPPPPKKKKISIFINLIQGSPIWYYSKKATRTRLKYFVTIVLNLKLIIIPLLEERFSIWSTFWADSGAR